MGMREKVNIKNTSNRNSGGYWNIKEHGMIMDG